MLLLFNVMPVVTDALFELRLARVGLLAESAGVAVRPSRLHGYGAFAAVDIARHAALGDYTGEVLVQRDIDARYGGAAPQTAADAAWAAQRRERGVDATGDYLWRVDDGVYIDAEDLTSGACWTRFLNHGGAGSNLRGRAIPVSIDGNPRVWFYALHDIKAGEELTYDYGVEYF